jgi:hypothetical protein
MTIQDEEVTIFKTMSQPSDRHLQSAVEELVEPATVDLEPCDQAAFSSLSSHTRKWIRLYRPINPVAGNPVPDAFKPRPKGGGHVHDYHTSQNHFDSVK